MLGRFAVRVAGVQGCRVAGFQGCRMAGLQGCRMAGVQDGRVYLDECEGYAEGRVDELRGVQDEVL